MVKLETVKNALFAAYYGQNGMKLEVWVPFRAFRKLFEFTNQMLIEILNSNLSLPFRNTGKIDETYFSVKSISYKFLCTALCSTMVFSFLYICTY